MSYHIKQTTAQSYKKSGTFAGFLVLFPVSKPSVTDFRLLPPGVEGLAVVVLAVLLQLAVVILASRVFCSATMLLAVLFLAVVLLAEVLVAVVILSVVGLASWLGLCSGSAVVHFCLDNSSKSPPVTLRRSNSNSAGGGGKNLWLPWRKFSYGVRGGESEPTLPSFSSLLEEKEEDV